MNRSNRSRYQRAADIDGVCGIRRGRHREDRRVIVRGALTSGVTRISAGAGRRRTDRRG